jgi:hypothetical protein
MLSATETNRDWKYWLELWGEIFEDTTVAAAVLDRLLHRATVVHIDGESYRMRAHRETLKGLREGVAGGGEIP